MQKPTSKNAKTKKRMTWGACCYTILGPFEEERKLGSPLDGSYYPGRKGSGSTMGTKVVVEKKNQSNQVWRKRFGRHIWGNSSWRIGRNDRSLIRIENIVSHEAGNWTWNIHPCTYSGLNIGNIMVEGTMTSKGLYCLMQGHKGEKKA